MTEQDWAAPRSTPSIFDWAVTEPPCRFPCTDWRHEHNRALQDTRPSSQHLEVVDDEP